MEGVKTQYGPLIGTIDSGTFSSKFMVFASETAEVLTFHEVDIPHIKSRDGWVEQDPMLILHAAIETINVTCDNLKKLNINCEDIIAVGLANQRETTILWDPCTGKTFYNAIVWMDMRTASTVDMILQNGKRNIDFLRSLCGLPVSTYFSALKIKWLMDNVDGVRKAMEIGRCLFGTVDSWLIWNLTGGVRSGIHVTDVTNASRTMLMNLKTLKWDSQLCKVFNIPMKILPEIRSSSEIFGYIKDTAGISGVPISGVLGDQQAALVGQMCFEEAQAKCTYGSGCFLLYNTGTKMINSENGLLTTVAYQFGVSAPVYALEGAVAIAGTAVKWLKDNLEIFRDFEEFEILARSVGTIGEVCFVPAFSGLYSPYWQKEARSIIIGATERTTTGHLIKATLEAACFQIKDVITAMSKDYGFPLKKLLVDGRMSTNNFLMQLQANYSGLPIVRPEMVETTSLGAAIAAGSAEGVKIWNVKNTPPVPCDMFYPLISNEERDIKHGIWQVGVRKSFDWTLESTQVKSGNATPHFVSLGIYIFLSFGIMVIAQQMMDGSSIT